MSKKIDDPVAVSAPQNPKDPATAFLIRKCPRIVAARNAVFGCTIVNFHWDPESDSAQEYTILNDRAGVHPQSLKAILQHENAFILDRAPFSRVEPTEWHPGAGAVSDLMIALKSEFRQQKYLSQLQSAIERHVVKSADECAILANQWSGAQFSSWGTHVDCFLVAAYRPSIESETVIKIVDLRAGIHEPFASELHPEDRGRLAEIAYHSGRHRRDARLNLNIIENLVSEYCGKIIGQVVKLEATRRKR